MLTPIVISLVGDQLGHSLCYEEHKGDFKQARQVAATGLGMARQAGDSLRLCDALLACGTVHLMQGKPAAATACFAEAEQLAHDDAGRQLYAVSGATLAAYHTNNLFPGGGGANGGEELDERNETFLLMIGKQSQRRTQLLGGISDPSTLLAHQVLYDLLTGILPMRISVELTQNTSSTDAEQILNYGLSVPQQFRQQAETLGADPSLLAYADMVAADMCWRGRRLDHAQQFLQRALQGYAQANDAAGAATCQMTWGDWLAAPFSSPIKWNFALQSGGSEGSGLSWTTEAHEFTQQGANLEQALVAYRTAEDLFQKAGAPRGIAALQLRHGYLAMLRGDYRAAAGCNRQASQAFKDCGDWLGHYTAQAHAVLSCVGAGEVAGQYELAEAIGRWGATEGSFSYALGLGMLFGRTARHWLLRQGNYERALAVYRLAETLYIALGATANQARSLVDQAATYKAVGESAAASAAYEQALDIYEHGIRDRPQIRDTLRMRAIPMAVDYYVLAIQKMDADKIEQSGMWLQRQLDQIQPTGAASMMKALAGGVFSMIQGKTDDTAPMRVMDWALSRLAQSTIEQAHVLAPLYRAQRARDTGDENTARRFFVEALEAARRSKSEGHDFLEASVHAHQKDYAQAQATFRRYLDHGGANAGFVGQLTNLMIATSATGRAEAQRQEERTYSQAFSFMVRIKAYGEAQKYLQKLQQLAGNDWWSNDERPWLNLSDCAEMYEGLGRLPDALQFYDQAIAELEQRRKLLSRDELKAAMAADKGAQYLYFLAARTALKLHEAALRSSDQQQAQSYAAQAFAYAERGRARALLDLMAGSAILAGATRGESQAMRDWRRSMAQLTLWRGLLAQERSRSGTEQPDTERIAALIQQIEAGEVNLRQVEGELAVSDPLLHQALSAQAQIITIEQVSAALEPGVALLEYAFLGDDLLAWAFTERGIVQTYRTSVDAKALGRQIHDLHRACENRAVWETLATSLSETLLAPLGEAICASQRLIIVPYGAAHSLPFHVLPWEGKPLIFSHTVSYLPSASALQFLERRQLPLPQRMLTVGDPARMAYQPRDGGAKLPLRPLPAAATEARFVASLFHEGRALVGEDATEPAVVELLGKYPLLHLATHGYLSEEAPLLSAIMLADGEALNVYELMGMRLNADLIVLSACNTAQGETTGGDDVLGLTRGLLAAGARAAVVSLWPVDDISTSLLMGEFYRAMRCGSPPGSALQLAQQHLQRLERGDIQAEIDKLHADLTSIGAERDAIGPLNATRDARRIGTPIAVADYSHPFFWAAFVLVGV